MPGTEASNILRADHETKRSQMGTQAVRSCRLQHVNRWASSVLLRAFQRHD